MEKPKKAKKQFDNFIKYSSLGIQMLVIIIAGVFGGYKLDTMMNNSFPWFLLSLSTLALVVAIYHAVKDFLRK
jgi:F0F1-type ATP synthase assembly protein I